MGAIEDIATERIRLRTELAVKDGELTTANCNLDAFQRKIWKLEAELAAVREALEAAKNHINGYFPPDLFDQIDTALQSHWKTEAET